MNTLYDLLGVGSDATLAQIELGFRRTLASHRARNGLQPGREQSHLQAIKAAYGVLSSPVRREFYDQKLRARRTDGENQFFATGM